MPAHSDNAVSAVTPPMAAGTASVAALVLVPPAEVLRLEAKLGGESEVGAAAVEFGALAVDAGASALQATLGAGGRILLTKQLIRMPAIAVGSGLSLPAPFTRGDALGAIEVPSGIELGKLASARPRVMAKESSAVGVPPRAVAAGGVEANAPADWTGRVSIESSPLTREHEHHQTPPGRAEGAESAEVFGN